ncbi:MAG TPA: CARDB domain-containing protein [Nitrospirota bacterium]
MRVYGAKNNDWVGARGIWNQESYHVTNVNDDGTIPQYESPSWLLNNTYRTQAPIGPATNPYLTPNLTASYMRAEQAGSSVNLAVRVGNGGAIASGPSVTVTYYDGNPANGGTVIGTATATRSLNPGDYQDVTYNWSGGSLGLHHLYAAVDAANAISECRKDDNQTGLDLTVAAGLPDLKVGPENIVLPAAPYYEGSIIPLTVNVNNLGLVSASNVLIRMYSGNPASGGTQIGADQIIPTINAGSSVPLVFSFDTLGKSGTNVLYFVVDPANAIIESSKSNNMASVSFTVQPAVLPDLAISASEIVMSSASPSEGNTVTVSATIHNQGTATGNIPVSFYLGNPASGGVLVSSQTIYPIMALGSSALAQATIDTTGRAGQQQVYIVIDPANTITESRKDNNSASQSFSVRSAGLNASIAVDKPTYNAGDVVTAAITAADTSGASRALTLSLFVQDSAGNTIATISTTDTVTLAPNGNTALSRTWNTGTTLAGQYTVISALSESGRIISRKSIGFSIAPDYHIAATAATDKISYNPNETAALTAAVTSQSKNYVYNNISAQVVVTGGTGTIFSDTRPIASLMPGAAFSFKGYVTIGTNPPGAYPVTLKIKDGAGAVIASSSASLEILSSSRTGAGMTGALTASPNPVYQGRQEAFTYSFTNNGNEDIAGLTPTIVVADPDTREMKTEITGQAADVRQGQTITANGTANTLILAPKTYLAVLQVRTAPMAAPKTLASASFEVKPGIMVSKTVPDVKNVLVWLNYPWNADQRVPKQAAIESALNQAGATYRIVLDKKDFQTELRNPLYTDFLILGDNQPLEDHFAQELREEIYAGKGLISSLFTRENLDQDMFGMTFKGKLPGKNYAVGIEGNALNIRGTFRSTGKAVKVETSVLNGVIATITDDTGKTTVRYPAIIGNDYGSGKTLFFAFDLGMSSTTAITFPALLEQSLAYIHTPADPTVLVPGQLVPVTISVRSLGAPFNLQLKETYPDSVQIGTCEITEESVEQKQRCQWITDNPWIRTLDLASNQTTTIRYYARPPDKADTYTFQTDIAYLENGSYLPYQTIKSQVTVAKSTAEALAEAISTLQSLYVKGREAADRDNAVQYLSNVRNRTIASQADRETDLKDLGKAADSVITITSADMTATRRIIDSLLLFWEAEWYYNDPGTR